MKGFFTPVQKLSFLIFLLPIFVNAQNLPAQLGKEPVALSSDELYVLSRVPQQELPEQYKGPNAPLLPSSVDNSTQPYFRPITWQSGYECGQSAGVAFNFTYETDRLRNLPANVAGNQYPTHFVWDFLNNGDNYTGASFFDSWEIIRACGTMNVTEYGGALNTGGYKRWISGYDAYKSGMSNRLTSVKAIRCDSPDGLLTLKYWLVDHLEGATVGGVANIYGQYFGNPSTVLPAGTPEAGKFVQTVWGGSPSHAWTIAGFNDSIRYDYNGDGQYTNDIDINGDGIVNMKDWEIGGVKIANGYAGTGWCNSGFCYTMYKVFADNMGSGGIWNHSAYIIDVKPICSPQLTMKVTLKHDSRNKLKVTAGLATDLTSAFPSVIQEFPIFNFQGGNNYMQGGTTEADKTIEFGLDLAPLLSQLYSGQQAKFFLTVQEVDPANSYNGEIVSCALVDYSSGAGVTINFPSTNVPILNNNTTRISLVYGPAINKPYITTTSLPVGQIYQPYNYTLGASGGTPPYLWDAVIEYPEVSNPSTFPAVTQQQLIPTNNSSGFAIKTLDFSFPFFNKVINKLYIYADGYIVFDDQPYTYPYLVDKNLLFRQTPIISPFMGDLYLYSSTSDGIWYEGDATSATIRWKASISGMPGSSSLNFAVKFYPNGTIEYYYGTMNYPSGYLWTGGLSNGDNKNYQYSLYNSALVIPANTLDKFITSQYPVEMTVTDDGHFTGTPQYAYQGVPVKFRVTDNNGISNTKVLNFTTNGLLLSYSVVSGGDSLIEYGETANISIEITNLATTPITNMNVSISETDPYITLLDSTQLIGTINPGQTMNILNAFSFSVSSQVPDHHDFAMTFHISSLQQNLEKVINLVAWAPDIEVNGISLQDGDNGELDPGESAPMIITFINKGGATVNNLDISLVSGDDLLGLANGSGSVTMLKPDSLFSLTCQASASSDAPFQHLYMIAEALTGGNSYQKNDSLWLFSGKIVEDFETGNFNKFNWQYLYVPWTIESASPFEGSFCAKSGWIWDSQSTTMSLTVKTLEAGDISFWERTSCENDPNGASFDHLAFFIDDAEMGRWDGLTDWYKVSYPLTPGYHTFKWTYSKDAASGSFADCAWIDFVTMPVFENALPVIATSPSSFAKTLESGQSSNDNLIIANNGGGKLSYSVKVFDTAANKLPEARNLTGSLITCNTQDFIPGQDFSWNFTLYNTSNDYEYIRDVKFDIPEGIEIQGATNFSGAVLGDLVYDGSTGNGPTITWHGESGNGRGVLKPGETATATLNGTISEGHTFDVFVVYSVRGDSIGADPHATSGELRIANSGITNSWLSALPFTGNLLTSEQDNILVSFDATGLPPAQYHADLLVRDPYNNIVTVPVSLLVTPMVAVPGPSVAYASRLMANYPNPFGGTTNLAFEVGEAGKVMIAVYDTRGVKIRTVVNKIYSPGSYLSSWDGRDDNGSAVPSGVYFCRMQTGSYTGNCKMIIIR